MLSLHLIQPMFKKILIALSILLGLGVVGCSILYKYAEEDYQYNADIERMEDAETMEALINEYFAKKGSYPLSEMYDGRDVYVIINEGETPAWIKEQNPSPLYVEDEVLETDLESVLGRELTLPYDPQKVSTGARPNFYMYSYQNGKVYLAIHLSAEYPNTIYVAPNYYKYESTWNF